MYQVSTSCPGTGINNEFLGCLGGQPRAGLGIPEIAGASANRGRAQQEIKSRPTTKPVTAWLAWLAPFSGANHAHQASASCACTLHLALGPTMHIERVHPVIASCACTLHLALGQTMHIERGPELLRLCTLAISVV